MGTVDFDPGAGTRNVTTSFPGMREPFMAKLDADGNLIWANALSGRVVGPNGAVIRDVAVGRNGEVLLAGRIDDGQFDVDPGPGEKIVGRPSSGYPIPANGFVAEYDSSGRLLWGRELLARSPSGSRVAFGPDGGAYLAVPTDVVMWPYMLGENNLLAPTLPGVVPSQTCGVVLARLGADGSPVALQGIVAFGPQSKSVQVAALAIGATGRAALAGTFMAPARFGSMTLTNSRGPNGEAKQDTFVTTLEAPRVAPPTLAPLRLTTPYDTGSSSTDGITSAKTLTFEVSGAGNDQRVEIFQGEILMATRTGPGKLLFAPGYDTTYNFRVRVVDPRRGPAAFSAPLKVTVDRSPPRTLFFTLPGTAGARGGDSVYIGKVEGGATAALLDSSGKILASKRVPLSTDPRFLMPDMRLTMPRDLGGTFRVHLRATDVAGNVTSGPVFTLQLTSVPNGPRVSSVVIAKQGTRQTVVLTFDRDLNAAGAVLATNFTLQGAGKDEKFNTRDDVTLKVSAVYNPAKRTVTLTTTPALNFNLPVRLFVTGIKGTNGQLLDGDGDGQPGGKYTVNFGPPAKV